MPISKIRRATRYIARYREIFSVLVRYGLADWAKRIDIDFAREILTRRADPALLALSTEERIRKALMELGPTWIKLGQTLSLRPDIVGIKLSNELKHLQSDVTPDSFDIVEKIVQRSLGRPLSEIFSDFEPHAVASASIGQVHCARLITGEKVAVKIRHHDIEAVVSADLDILKDLAELLENYVHEAKYYRPMETVERFSIRFLRELDFNREARNIVLLEETLEDEKRIKIPKVYEEFASREVLVMEWIDGVPLGSLDDKTREKIDTNDLAMAGAEAFLKMIFINGFYHADPHPGNIMILPDSGQLALLDFGMVGRLSGRMREHIEDMVYAIEKEDAEKLARVIMRASDPPPDLDKTAFEADVSDFISYYGKIPVSKIRLFEAVNELISIIHRHHVILQSEIVLLSRTIVTLEGSARLLSAEFNLFGLIAPYRKQIMGSPLIAIRRLAKARRFYDEFAQFAETVPPALADIIDRFRKGTIDIHMEHKHLEGTINRLTFGILTASIFIGSSMVLAAGVPPLVFGLSIPGIIGYCVSLLMGIRVMWAIMMTGRLD